MSFQDIKGQDKAIHIVKEYIKHSSLAGGYLFEGPEGIGKGLVAKTLAKAVNCQKESADSCDTCVSCSKIDKNQHPDVHIINTENNNEIKIEYVRQLHKDIYLKSYEGKTKVFIIDNAHNLTAQASGALLKILEEPPRDSLIILISAKPALLFKTIISRCKIIKFYPLKRSELKGVLKKDYRLEDDLAHFLAYFSEGRLGRALRLKDTDILREKNRIIDAFTILRKSSLENISMQNRENVRRWLNILASWFRDIYLIKIGLSPTELINLDRKDELLRFMNRYTLFNLDNILKSICDSLLYLEQNVNIKLLLSNLRAELWRG